MTESGTNIRADGFHAVLDRDSATPIHVQLEVALRDAIRTGRLPGGSVVPATRRLAEQFGVSRGVVVEAYQQLTAEGYLVSSTGGYTRVAEAVAQTPPAGERRAATAPAPVDAVDFRYGRPDVSQFPRAAWLRTLRTVLAHAPNERLNYSDGRGAPELRVALAEYLNRVRGTWATPDQVIACNGFAQGIALVCQVLAAQGIRRLAVEDPSDPDARREAAFAGMQLIHVPVTPTGIDTDVLAASNAQAVLITPAHQFPAGCVLSPERRTAIVEWAKRTGGLIIEDDYDAEYRYDQTPVGSLQGLAPEHVIYAGTASKTLAPGLRLGWIIAPPALADAFATRKHELDRGSPVIDQLAFAEFLVKGEFDRHLRRMRPIYRKRRDALLSAMQQSMPAVRTAGIAAGLHVVCWMPDDIDEDAITAEAARRGLAMDSLTKYRVDATSKGLIIGYAKIDEASIVAGVRILAETLRALGVPVDQGSSGALLPAS
jgi:GntR family transcriptional regulator/MocR family aminotransferase